MPPRQSASLHHALFVPLDQDVCRSNKTAMATTRWVLAVLTSHMEKHTNEVIVSHHTLAEEASMSRSTVIKALNALRQMKVIYVHQRGRDRPNRYVYHEKFTSRSPDAVWRFKRYQAGTDRLLALITCYNEGIMSHDLAALLGVSVRQVNKRLKDLEIEIPRTRRRGLRGTQVDSKGPEVYIGYETRGTEVDTMYLSNTYIPVDRSTYSRRRATPEGGSTQEDQMISSHGKYFPTALPPFPYVTSNMCETDERLQTLFPAEHTGGDSLFNMSRSTDEPERKKRTPRSTRLVDTWDAKDITDEFFQVWVHHFGKTPGHTGRRAGFVKRVSQYLSEEDLSPAFMLACMVVFMRKVRSKSITWDKTQYEPWRIYVSRITTLSKDAGNLLSSNRKRESRPLLNPSGSLRDFVRSDALKEVPDDVRRFQQRCD